MRSIITIFVFMFCSTLFSQVENEIWTKTDTIRTDLYEFQVPTAWRNLGKMLSGGQGPEQYFEASGKGLPVSYNNGPVIVTVFLVKLDNSDLKSAKKGIISGYFENPDRVFQKKNDYNEEELTISDDSKSVILNTRFYRKSKGLNQSRYDLVTCSEKHKIAYMFTISVQYSDKSYSFEVDHDLTAYAKKLYSTFKWI